ncbi:hypothetical protein DPMN_049048 [Dreissena polymorpha]|uniref:Uncharacterized protein n=1 Tax=Dreissena polymorpha TaxID=45954 RepID=A0A9D4DEH7_DREPO|nr:hypothetical protein DPMN_049048 [Dreissena polymorpha]
MSLISRVQSNLTSKLTKWMSKSESSRNAVVPGLQQSIDELVTSVKSEESERPGGFLRSNAVNLSSKNIGKDKAPKASNNACLPEEISKSSKPADTIRTTEPVSLALLPEEVPTAPSPLRPYPSPDVPTAPLVDAFLAGGSQQGLPMDQSRAETGTTRPKFSRSLSQTTSNLRVPGFTRNSWR